MSDARFGNNGFGCGRFNDARFSAVSFGGGRFNRRLVLFQICFRHSAVIIEGRCRFSNRLAQIFHARQGVFGL